MWLYHHYTFFRCCYTSRIAKELEYPISNDLSSLLCWSCVILWLFETGHCIVHVKEKSIGDRSVLQDSLTDFGQQRDPMGWRMNCTLLRPFRVLFNAVRIL